MNPASEANAVAVGAAAGLAAVGATMVLARFGFGPCIVADVGSSADFIRGDGAQMLRLAGIFLSSSKSGRPSDASNESLASSLVNRVHLSCIHALVFGCSGRGSQSDDSALYADFLSCRSP